MKKTLMMLAAGIVASVASAATVSWSGTAVTTTGASTGPTSWTMYLMDSSITSISALEAAFASNDAAAITEAISDATVLTTTGLAQGTSLGRWSTSTTLPTSFKEGDAVTFYTLILDSSVPASGNGNYFLTAEKSGEVSDSTSLAMSFGTQAGKSWTGYTTGAVPEPTSGVLLLLGMGALALRRKQK